MRGCNFSCYWQDSKSNLILHLSHFTKQLKDSYPTWPEKHYNFVEQVKSTLSNIS